MIIIVGDIVDFVWVGDGYSIIFDVILGLDSWNFGVIGFGFFYEVSIINFGVYWYYCIFYGGFNGIGMLGVLVVNCFVGG